MGNRRITCFCAAGFIGLGLTLSAADTIARPAPAEVVVNAKKFDPDTQRIVSYRDLNLAFEVGQRTLKGRIYRTANSLCFVMNNGPSDMCTDLAVDSTKDQVAAAIVRAQRQMAGLSVGPAVAISMVVGGK